MSEVLYIRLGSQQHNKLYWLVWSESEKEIIASGELESVNELHTLADKASQRSVIVLVPGQEVSLKALQVPGKSERAIRMAAPYMLEDELAQDVEQLFFAYGKGIKDEQSANCHLAVVSKNKMDTWQQWLAEADIVCDVMTPEVLALPSLSEQWSMIAYDDELVIRQGAWQGVTLEPALIDIACQHWLQQELPTIKRFTDLPESTNELPTEVALLDLPLAVIAAQGKPTFNLLQGAYKQRKQQASWLKHWSLAAGFLLAAVLLSFVQQGLSLYQVKTEQAALEQQIKDTYLAAFPKTKRVRISTVKSQLKQKLAQSGRGNQQESFLAMMMAMEPAFKQVKSLQLSSMKFDGKRGEVRIQASAKDYQSFDQFKSLLEQRGLQVNQGAQNNQGNLVTGSISVRRRS